MFDFVPVEIYTTVQYNFLLLIIAIIILNSLIYDIGDEKNILFFNILGIIVAIFYTLYIGQRQINNQFGDTVIYNKAYTALIQGKKLIITKDYLFNYLMVLCSKIMSVRSFFQLIDFIYILPCVIFSYKYFGRYWFFAFYMFLASFSFWTFGTNGLRNGIGTAIFILALSFYNKRIIMYILFIVSYFMHASLVIPIVGFITSGLYKDPKAYIYIWLLSIPLSLAGGNSWANFFATLGFEEDRTQGYLTGGSTEYNNQFSKTGFRWDFLLYSAFAVFAGWYFIVKKNITDKFYIHMFGIYCISNAFWILVITAAFSNRFAYLSWFLMPPVIAYPMFRYRIWKNQYKTFAILLFIYFMFTYYMNVIKS